MTDLPLLASGRDADVYALDGTRVLRRYRRGGDVAAEAAVMVHVGGLGFPAPAVHQADGTDLVLERVPGSTMLSAFATGELGLVEGATVLADLHRRLHALPTLSRESGFSVLHLDLHPDNVILSPSGPVVIDWRNTRRGDDGAIDVATTWLIMATSQVPDTSLKWRMIDKVRHLFVEALLRNTDRAAATRQLPRVARYRLADRNLLDSERPAIHAFVRRVGATS